MKIRLLSSLVVFCAFTLLKAQIDVSKVDLNLISKGLNALGPNFERGTGRYTGMAGSMGALGGDLSAMYMNPAGSGVFITNNFTTSISVDSKNSISVLGESYNNGNTTFNFTQIGGLFNLGGKKKWKAFNFGFLYNKQNDDETLIYPPNTKIIAETFNNLGATVDSLNFQSYVDDQNINKQVFIINFGTNYNNKIYFGANLNLHSAKVEYHKDFVGQNVTTSQLSNFIANKYPYNEDLSGVSFGLGIIGRITNELRLGMSYQTPIGWNEIKTTYNEYYYDSNTGLTDSFVGTGYWDQDKATSASRLMFSLAGVFWKKWAINADVVGNFNKNLKYKPEASYIGTDNFVSSFVRNSWDVKLGTEYRLKDLKLRAGYSFTGTPMKDIYITGGYKDGNGTVQNTPISNATAGKKNLFSFGMGYTFNSFFVDLAYQHIQQKYSHLIYGVHVNPGYYPLDMPTLKGDITQKQNNFILSIGWNF